MHSCTLEILSMKIHNRNKTALIFLELLKMIFLLYCTEGSRNPLTIIV